MESLMDILNREIPKETLEWLKEKGAIEVANTSYIIKDGEREYGFSNLYVRYSKLSLIKKYYEEAKKNKPDEKYIFF